MRRNWLIVLALSLVAFLAQPTPSLCQDSPEQETYNGEPLCPHVRGVHPRATYQPSPEYDNKDRKKKVQGLVRLSAIVTTEGRAVELKVTKSLTPGLDQQAIKAVSQWTFEPAAQDGKPCPMRIAIEVDFRLY